MSFRYSVIQEVQFFISINAILLCVLVADDGKMASNSRHISCQVLIQ